tara:strand:+ start:185 stop:406 length:222 start_codon:yes stop_codon:yes gene_type:complete
MARPVHVEIKAKPGEPIERMLRRFQKKVKKEKILEEVRNRRYYEKPSTKRRRKKLQRQRIMRQLREAREAKEQ